MIRTNTEKALTREYWSGRIEEVQEIETHSGKDKDDKDKRHRKGPKRQNLEDLPAENRGNVLRCRKYRLAKKEKEFNYINKLNDLESGFLSR